MRQWLQVDSAGSTRLFRIIGLRLTQSIVTLLGASILIWTILSLAPGDPAVRTLQAQGVREPRRAQIEARRLELGLDKPLPVQYAHWLSRVFRGDLARSYQSGQPVTVEFARRLPVTMMLAAAALGISLLLSVLAALTAAAYHERWPDHVIRFLTQVGVTAPSFLVGLVILHFIVLKLGWGRVLSGGNPGQVWLPAFCLAIGRAGDWTQLLRANLLEVLGSRYVLVARSRGATRLRVLLRYALPNAALPFLTAVGIGIGVLVGGAPIVEAVFSWPGLGSYVVEAIAARDLPVIQGFVLVNTLIYVGMSFLVDLSAAVIDPRGGE